jgi:hypothetical protein
MSLVTVSEARALFTKSTPGNDLLYALVAGMSSAFSITCNRTFAMRASEAIEAAGKLKIFIPFHGLMPGQQVSITIAGEAADPIDLLTIEEAEFTTHEFQVPFDQPLGDLCDAGVTVRPVQTEVHSTRGEPAVFVDRLPLAEVVSVSTKDADGAWESLAVADYMIADTRSGLSFSGEVALDSTYFPSPTLKRCWKPAAVQVEFIAGEPTVPAAVVHAVSASVKNASTRQGSSGLQSESLDYYSYTRMSPQAAAETFGDVMQTIRQYRIPVA